MRIQEEDNKCEFNKPLNHRPRHGHRLLVFIMHSCAYIKIITSKNNFFPVKLFHCYREFFSSTLICLLIESHQTSFTHKDSF